MAFNFFGVCSSGQWLVFKAFALVQKVELQLRRMWLQKEISKIGTFVTTYGDDFMPQEFIATPHNSYAAKLMEAYKILGGVPERDMLLRTLDQPVFLTSGVGISKSDDDGVSGGYSDVFSNGRRFRGGQRFDRDLGLTFDKLKKWQLEAVKHKREHLEYKIKRALDYSDQLQLELNQIEILLGDGTGSVDDQILQIELAINTPGSMTVVDNPDDIFGLSVGKIGDLVVTSTGDASVQTENLRVPK
jgi:hypothetical protein